MTDLERATEWLCDDNRVDPEDLAKLIATIRREGREEAFEEAAKLIESDKIPEVETLSAPEEPGVIDIHRRKKTAEMAGIASAFKTVLDFKIDSYARSIRRLMDAPPSGSDTSQRQGPGITGKSEGER